MKQKDKVGRPDIDAFDAVLARENRTKWFFVSFDFTSDAMKGTSVDIVGATLRNTDAPVSDVVGCISSSTTATPILP